MINFSKLLNALFGTRAPSDLARSTQVNWDVWLQPIIELHPGDVATLAAQVGEDPGYDDGFLAIKEQVAKLSDVDDTLIINTAERLLKHCAKDVRVAVYYLYGRMRRDGAEGVASGFELLSALIDRFGTDLLPARVETRKTALEWLAGATFADRLDRVQGLTGDVLERALSALALITESTASWPDDARPQLSALYRRFEGRVESPKATDHPSLVAPPSGSTATSLQSETGVSSSRDLLDRARQMASFLREQPQGYFPAYRLMRCIRWDTLTEVPPCDPDSRTRLVPPRSELRVQLKRLLAQKQWLELLDKVELAFAEGANHFWLDLQYYAFVAQAQAGGDFAPVRDLAATDCALMLERLPGFHLLSFSDGTPFADDSTLEWIARYAGTRDLDRGEMPSSAAAQSANTDWAEIETKAQELATQQGLDSAFLWLQSLPAQDGERDRFVRQMVMARIAERAERPDTAMHLLATLDTSTRRFALPIWEPTLAFEAKQHLMRLLKVRMTRKDADKPALALRIDTLIGELTAIDAARAVALD
ncbi:type VI secretion system protein TssA [Caballeronia sordidicola]|uniref:type VI secretion system protein TssA n=1 Tax=Caballeronia sordidicola TaxID=196367 RepID=UPI0004D021BF|nr:type VI secretion system protein TssA [Caballeronia sordidicola]